MNAKQRLLASATPKEEVKKETKQAKETIIVEDEFIQQSINRLASANVAMKALEGHQETEKKIVKDYAIDLALDSWVEAGQVTPNPRLQTKNNSSVLFQIKDTTKKFRIPNKEINGKSQKTDVKTFLEEKEFPKVLIERLLKENEFTERDVTNIPLPKIEQENQPLAEKIYELIAMASEGGVRSIKNPKKTIAFTTEEVGQLLINSNEISVKEYFMARMPLHALNVTKNKAEAKEYLKLLFETFPPQPAVSHAKTGNDHELILKDMLDLLTEEEREQMAIDVHDGVHSQRAVEAKPVRKETHDANEFTLKVEGLNVDVIRKSDNMKLCSKECKDPSHLDNTIKQWKRDGNVLEKFIAKNIKLM